MRKTILMLVLGFLLAGALPEKAEAAPCCMSATALGMGRLLIWEDMAFGYRSTIRGGLGDWDPNGRYHSWKNYSEVEWRNELWGMVAIGRRFSAFGRVPANLLVREGGDIQDISGGLGDISIGARYEVLEIGEILELPAIALTFSLLTPTGRPTERSKSPLAADVTGRGAWELALALSLEYTVLPWFLRLDTGFSVPLPNERRDLGLTQRLGIAVDVVLSGGIELLPDLVLSLSPRMRWTDDTRYREVRVPKTSRLELATSLGLSWRFDPHWTVQAAFESPFFFSFAGKNESAALSGTLGIRYGVF